MKKTLAIILMASLLFTTAFSGAVYATGQQISVVSLLNVVDISANYATQIKFSLSAANSLQNALLTPTISDKVLINGRTIAEINAYQAGGIEAYWNDNGVAGGGRDGYYVLHLFIRKTLGSYGLLLNGKDSIKVLSGLTTANGDIVSVYKKYGCNSAGVWYPFLSELATSATNGTIDVDTSEGWQVTDLPPATETEWDYRFGPSVILNPDNSIEEWSSAKGLDAFVNNYDEVGTRVAEYISGSDVVAQKFTARWAFDGLDILAPSWSNNIGSLTLKLFYWNTNYATSIAGTAVVQKTFVNFTDNSRLTINFDRIQAGNYIWTLSNPVENVGVWRYNGSNFSSNVNYRNGVAVTGGDYLSRTIDSLDKFSPSGTLTNTRIKTGETAAQKFVSNYTFNAVSVHCPSYSNNLGNLTLSLYTWNTDYNTTIAGTPVAQNLFANFIDNSYLQISFSPLNPGTYMWVLNNPTETVGVYKYSTSAVSGNVNYYNGSVVTGDYKSRLSICYWDCIKYKKSTDGGHTWGTEMVVNKPTPGGNDTLSTCDPGVVFFGGYYYIGYTSTLDYRGTDNDLFVGRSTSPTGPFDKWNGSGWGGGSPQAVITYTGPTDQFGIGEPSFVVKNNVLYIYYSYLSGTIWDTKLATASATNANWPASLTYYGTAIQRYDTTSDSTDIKYVDSLGKFIAVGFYNRMNDNPALLVYESLDGYNYYPSKNFMIYKNIRPTSHNLGISGTPDGHLDTTKNNFIISPAGNWGTKPWNMFLTPISFYSAITDLAAINMAGTTSAEISLVDTVQGYGQYKLPATILPTGNFNENTTSVTYGDYNKDGIDDLYYISKQNTGSGHTEVHILDGASNFQTWLAHVATPLPNTDIKWEFIAADYNGDGYSDLYCINKNSSGQTTIQVLNGLNFTAFLAGSTPIVMPYGATDVNWSFDVAKYNSDAMPDIIGVFQTGSGGKTELHIVNGSSFTSYITQTATILGFTDELFDFKAADYNHDGKLDIYCIFKAGSSNKTELHVLDGNTNFQSYLAEIKTPLSQTNSNWIFGIGNF